MSEMQRLGSCAVDGECWHGYADVDVVALRKMSRQRLDHGSQMPEM